MTYDKKKIPILGVKEGYNKVHLIYKKYHKDLDNWDNGVFLKFLPRNLSHISILDIGCGDGRLFKHFKGKSNYTYTGLDISEKMLKKLPGSINKVLADLEQPLEFESESFDVVLSFFVLLHINNLENLFEQVYRVLKTNGRFIVLHHIEERPFEYNLDGEKFKINNYKHRYENIEQIAENNFFEIDIQEIKVGSTLVAKLYCFTKK